MAKRRDSVFEKLEEAGAEVSEHTNGQLNRRPAAGLNDMSLIYLASPYSDPDPAVQVHRFEQACEAAAGLMRRGLNIFSPIAHTHPIHLYGLPGHWEFWKKYDEAFLEVCESMFVLTLPGWDKSRGVAGEIAIMQAAGKAVEYVSFASAVTARQD